MLFRNGTWSLLGGSGELARVGRRQVGLLPCPCRERNGALSRWREQDTGPACRGDRAPEVMKEKKDSGVPLGFALSHRTKGQATHEPREWRGRAWPLSLSSP